MDLSVIIPIYNVEEYLPSCLDSVRRACGALKTEYILVDDGSTDRSGEIARQYAEQDPSFRYIRKENGGVSTARNLGVSLASGEYLCFPDSDDIAADNIYQRLYEAAVRDGSDMAVCGVCRLSGDKIVRSSLHERAYRDLEDTVTHVVRHPRLVYDSMCWNRVIRRAFYEETGVKWPEGTLYQDIPVLFTLNFHANQVSVIRETGYFWRIRETGTSATQGLSDERNLSHKIEMQEQLFRILDDEVRDPEIRFEVERKALADFSGNFRELGKMPRDQAMWFTEQIATFTERNIRQRSAGRMDLLQRQILDDLGRRDLDHLIRVEEYRENAYRDAAVVTEKGGPVMRLPEEIFRIPDRDAGSDLAETFPTVQIFSADKEQDALALSGALYIRRFSVPETSGIRLSAFLLNEQTGTKKDLTLEQMELPGEWADRQDGEGKYDYRGTGFRLYLRQENLNDPKLTGDNRLMIRYGTDVASGVRMLTGLRKQTRRILKRSGMIAGGRTVSFSVDVLGTLNVHIEEKIDVTVRKRAGKPRSSSEKKDMEHCIGRLQKLVLKEEFDSDLYGKLIQKIRAGAAKAIRRERSVKKRLKYAAYALAPKLMLSAYRLRHRK